jgi:hypothetical protein
MIVKVLGALILKAFNSSIGSGLEANLAPWPIEMFLEGHPSRTSVPPSLKVLDLCPMELTENEGF